MSYYPPDQKTYQPAYPPPIQEGQAYNPNMYYAPPPPAPMGGNQTSGAVPNSGGQYPGAMSGAGAGYMDPTAPRPNDILPLHPAIIQQRQIAASLPPCPKGGYHELRKRYALGANAGTVLSVICFPVVCCCVRNETTCIKCGEKFNIDLPSIQ
ncbi:hypothetical protein BC939DRAFT_462672 [Gamsiella multidivaricata]|uniref:uncharacterized protein n=1 Tax=Gamsiella multidivaricata TaxID=101098 RepID=UPI00221F25D1|nr:uncharacterized protein BC939DRAFT_462672 [Gamsiella multidivaricata]KAG0366088.1 hypothetical protein BGZ54_005835 [Gamsiella multidivaricata]KAI7818498.1 hypothetical protein BC939DRAFT_462672 [Gamsiella multidivaricata]